MLRVALILVFFALLCQIQGCTMVCYSAAVSPEFVLDEHLAIHSAYKTTEGDAVLLVEGKSQSDQTLRRYTIRIPVSVLCHDDPMDQRGIQWLREHQVSQDLDMIQWLREQKYKHRLEYDASGKLIRVRFPPTPKSISSIATTSLNMNRSVIKDGWPVPDRAGQERVSNIPVILVKPGLPFEASQTEPSAAPEIPGSGERFLFEPGNDLVGVYIPVNWDTHHAPISIYTVPLETQPHLGYLLFIPAAMAYDAGLWIPDDFLKACFRERSKLPISPK